MADIKVTIETEHAILKDLSPEQVKELRDILLQMFPVEREHIPVYPRYRYVPWYEYQPCTGEYWYTTTASDALTISCAT